LAVGFPSEAELMAKLHRGMSVEECISVFGPAGRRSVERSGSVRLFYHASPNELTDEREGYAGFELHFVRNTLVDYRILGERPSFRSNTEIPSDVKWLLWVFAGFVVVLIIYVRFLRFLGEFLARRGILKNYRWRDLGSEKLPPEFRFVSHAMTLGDVMQKLGPPSRLVELPVDADLPPGTSFITTNLGKPAIVIVEYRLPYGAPVYVMPEFPFDVSSRIRAMFQGNLQIEGLRTGSQD
jgi:hypothetical protein